MSDELREPDRLPSFKAAIPRKVARPTWTFLSNLDDAPLGTSPGPQKSRRMLEREEPLRPPRLVQKPHCDVPCVLASREHMSDELREPDRLPSFKAAIPRKVARPTWTFLSNLDDAPLGTSPGPQKSRRMLEREEPLTPARLVRAESPEPRRKRRRHVGVCQSV